MKLFIIHLCCMLLLVSVNVFCSIVIIESHQHHSIKITVTWIETNQPEEQDGTVSMLAQIWMYSTEGAVWSFCLPRSTKLNLFLTGYKWVNHTLFLCEWSRVQISGGTVNYLLCMCVFSFHIYPQDIKIKQANLI